MDIKVIEGSFCGENKKFAIVVARFNSFLTDRLLEGAIDGLVRHGVDKDNITIVRIPGAFEIPLTAGKLANTKKFDAIITLGAVVRGDTPHFDYVAAEVSKGVATISLQTGVPVIFGVLTTDTLEQAEVRVGGKGSNKGFDAALTALELTNVLSSI